MSLAFVRGIHRTGEFPAQMASNMENVSIWWRHHENQLSSQIEIDWIYNRNKLQSNINIKSNIDASKCI